MAFVNLDPPLSPLTYNPPVRTRSLAFTEHTHPSLTHSHNEFQCRTPQIEEGPRRFMGIWAAFLLQGPHSAVGRVGPLRGEDNEQKVLLTHRPGRASLSYNNGVVQLSSHVPKKKKIPKFLHPTSLCASNGCIPPDLSCLLANSAWSLLVLERLSRY